MDINVFFCDDFLRVRNKKSVAPCTIDDFYVESFGEASLLQVMEKYTLIPYAFTKDLAEVLLTCHTQNDFIKQDAFFYQGQYRNAEALVRINSKLLSEINCVSPSEAVFIVSPGRVGSTLVSNLLRMGGIDSFSEPDFISSFNKKDFNNSGLIHRQGFVKLLKDAVGLVSGLTGQSLPVFKLRSYSSSIIPQIAKVCENPKFIFLFRNIDDWSRSVVKTFDYDIGTLSWLMESNIKALEFVKQNGFEYLVVDYDDLVSSPNKVVSKFSEFLSPVYLDVKSAIKALEVDSQVGSGIERAENNKRSIQNDVVGEFISCWEKTNKERLFDLGIDFLILDES